MIRTALASLLHVLLLAPISAANGSEFLRLGVLLGTDNSFGRAISADGTTVVGLSQRTGRQEAFRWTRDTGMVGLGDLPGGLIYSFAHDVSADGMIIVGSSQSSRAGGEEAFRWTAQTGLQPLHETLGDSFLRRATGIADDGSVIVGLTGATSGSGCESCLGRWTEPDHLGIFEPPPGFDSLTANNVSANGSIVVGTTGDYPFGEAFRLTPNGGLEWLDGEFGSGPHSDAIAVSADGEVVVGRVVLPDTFDAFRWTEEAGMVMLGLPPDGDFLSSQATVVSADGAVVLGTSSREFGQEAFVWTEPGGMRVLADVLASDYGLAESLEGFVLNGIRGISAGRTAIAGTAIDTAGQQQAFVAYLDFPLGSGAGVLAGDYNGDGLVEQSDLDLVLVQWGEDAATPPQDWVNDLPAGLIDQQELDRVLANWGDTLAAAQSTSTIPEPISLVSCLLAIVALLAARLPKPFVSGNRDIPAGSPEGTRAPAGRGACIRRPR